MKVFEGADEASVDLQVGGPSAKADVVEAI